MQTVLDEGVRGDPYVDALAVARDHEISVLGWNYHDDDLPGPSARVRVTVTGLPRNAKRVLLRQYRIDETHSNSWTVWKRMGSPEQPSPEQYAALEAAGDLQQLNSPQWIAVQDAELRLDLTFPRQSVSLLQLSW